MLKNKQEALERLNASDAPSFEYIPPDSVHFDANIEGIDTNITGEECILMWFNHSEDKKPYNSFDEIEGVTATLVPGGEGSMSVQNIIVDDNDMLFRDFLQGTRLMERHSRHNLDMMVSSLDFLQFVGGNKLKGNDIFDLRFDVSCHDKGEYEMIEMIPHVCECGECIVELNVYPLTRNGNVGGVWTISCSGAPVIVASALLRCKEYSSFDKTFSIDRIISLNKGYDIFYCDDNYQLYNHLTTDRGSETNLGGVLEWDER